MSKSVLLIACLFAAVAFAGTTGTTCEDGIPIELDELYEGDTRGFSNTPIQCNTYKYSPKGIWYTFKANESQAVIFNTCDQRTSMDSVIFVFSSCNKQGGYINDCFTMDDDGCNDRQSLVMFTAEEGKTYHVYVTGFLNSTGLFYLSTAAVQPPTNYECSAAFDVNHLPYAAEGETGTCLNVNDTCTPDRHGGLWYHVKGTGHPLVAHTCNQNTNFDTAMLVIKNCDGGEPRDNCVAYNNDACYTQSMVHWNSTQDQDYYVFVFGFNNARGRFSLAIEERTLHPNSYCYEPIVIDSIPYHYTGWTQYMDVTNAECRNNVTGQHSMYFRVQGTNRKLVVTTCTSSSTVNDSIIDVYSACNSDGSGHQCVASNDDYCGLGAQVVFFATSDSYFIAVSAASQGVEGVHFHLAVMPYEETKNSECWFAQDIDSFPDVLLGNSTQYDPCEQSCDGGHVSRRGGWWRYKHFGADKTITLSTCNPDNVMSARLEVYNDCNEMSCVAQADPDSRTNCTNTSFIAKNGKTYNIFVTAAQGAADGYFHVDFYEAVENPHGTCEEAYFINRGSLPWRVEDDTMTAVNSWSTCENVTKKGVWVSVIGTGTKLVATTCDSHTGFDTVIEVYETCPDSSMAKWEHCLWANDDNPSCGRSSEVEWASTAGQYYWIFVTGFASSAGVFVLNVFEKESMINAKCRTAVGIRNLPYYDYGLTTYCDMSNASCKSNPRKGNWYEIIGNDHWITLSTCHPETDFATEIEVYLGCSDNGGEVCVNHNHDYRCAPKTEITFAGVKNQLFYIFITGVDDVVAEEGFFLLSAIQGEKLPNVLSSSSEAGGESELTGGEKFLIATGVFMGIGVVAAAGAVAYGFYKRRHLSYQEISTSG